MSNSNLLVTEKPDNYPNLLCVGAQKAATTSFSGMIRQHPNVYTPAKKELHFFDQEKYQYKNKEQYLSWFKGSEEYKIRAEFTPEYLYFEEATARISELLGKEVKIIIFLRNPVDRAFSQYLMERDRGLEPLSFLKAFEQESSRIQQNYHEKYYHSYFDRGMYSKQVKRYLESFENVLIVLFDDFINQTEIEMSRIFDFMEIDHIYIPLLKSNTQRTTRSITVKLFIRRLAVLLLKIPIVNHNRLLKKIHACILQMNSNSKKSRTEIDPSFAKILQDYYYDDICDLEKIISKDLTSWKIKY